MMEGLLHQALADEIHKRDDDATIELLDAASGAMRVTTTVALDRMTPLASAAVEDGSPALQPQDRQEEENLFVERPDKVTIAATKYLFIGMALASLFTVIAALPFYMWNIPTSVLVTFAVLGCVAVPGATLAMFALQHWCKELPRSEWFALGCLALCFYVLGILWVTGCIAGLARSPVPIQVLAIEWVQFMVLTIYLQWLGPLAEEASFMHACLAMALGSLAVWAASIFTFVHEHDWLIALLMLAYALLMLMYAAHQMQSAINGKLYALNRYDMLAAFMNYHVGIPLLLVKCHQRQGQQHEPPQPYEEVEL